MELDSETAPPLPLTLLGHPVELDERLLARLVEQPESVDAETRHEAVRLGDAHVIEKERQLWWWCVVRCVQSGLVWGDQE